MNDIPFIDLTPYLFTPGRGQFICPKCGKKCEEKDEVIFKIQTGSKYIGAECHGRFIERKYLESYYNVRFCPDCAERKFRKRRMLRRLLLFWLPSIAAIFSLIHPKRSIGLFIGVTIILEISFVAIFVVWDWITMTMGRTLDVEHAARCNALAPHEIMLRKPVF